MSAFERQPPVPLHTLPVPHSSPGSVPSGIAVHVPTLPGRLHAWQVPLHAVSQQTPSTQLPVEQTVPSVPQLPPGPRQVRWHAPAPSHAFMHEPTLAQSPLGSVPAAANWLPQPFMSQMLTVHAAVGGGQTTPVPPLHTPPTQVVPVTQALPLAHDVPSATAAKPHPVDGSQVVVSHGFVDVAHMTDMPPWHEPL